MTRRTSRRRPNITSGTSNREQHNFLYRIWHRCSDPQNRIVTFSTGILAVAGVFLLLKGCFTTTGDSNEPFKETKIQQPIINPDSLVKEEVWATPHLFYKDTAVEKMGTEEMVDLIQYSNGDITVTVDAKNDDCALHKFVIKNEERDGQSFHFIEPIAKYESIYSDWDLPITEKIVRQDRPDYYEKIDKEMSAGIFPRDRCFITESESGLSQLVELSNPELKVKISNNSSKSFFVTKIDLMVHESKVNSFPLIFISSGFGNDFALHNFGWGSAKNIRAKFNIQTTDEKIDFKRKTKHELFMKTLLPTDDDSGFGSGVASLQSYFLEEGVNVDQIEKTNEIPEKAYGRFKNHVARIVGTVYYEGTLANGQSKKDSIPFAVLQIIEPWGIGGSTEDIYDERPYHIKLKTNASKYSVSRRIDAPVYAHHSNLFSLKLFSGKSTYHYFDMIIYLDNGKTIPVRNIFFYDFIDFPDYKRMLRFQSKETRVLMDSLKAKYYQRIHSQE